MNNAMPHNEALHFLQAPVAVIGSAHGPAIGGLTAAWVSRISHDPAMLMVSIGHTRNTYELIRNSDYFSVSILCADQTDIARHFGMNSQRDIDKWAAMEHLLLNDSIPALTDCASRMLCEVKRKVVAGDHDCFFGEVIESQVVRGGETLLYNRKDYL